MGVTPFPILLLLFFVGLGPLVFLPVFLLLEANPRCILTIVPHMIIVVLFVVHTHLNAGILRKRSGYDGHGSEQGSAQNE